MLYQLSYLAAPAEDTGAVMIWRMRDVPVSGDVIRLGQLLKLSGIAESGADARALLEAGAVTVNGEPETRRGRQLRRGDVVVAGEECVRVA